MLLLNKPPARPFIAPVTWALLMALIIGLYLFYSGARQLSTNLMELLPATEQDQSAADAANDFSGYLGRWIVFVVSAPERGTARSAARDLGKRLEHSGDFVRLMSGVDEQQLKQTSIAYYPWRFGLLPPEQRALPPEQLGQQLVGHALSTLASPVGMVSSQQLLADPLFLLPTFFQSLRAQGNEMQVDDGLFTRELDGEFHILISGVLSPDALQLNRQDEVAGFLNRSRQGIAETYPGSSVTASGMIFYMQAGADSARSEISTIGVGSLLGILLLLLVAFRTVSPLLLCTLSIGAGVACGFLTTALVFGQVHIMTLVFGASLIGVSVDYAFHFMAEWLRQGKTWLPQYGLKHILPGITLGLVTSLLGYLPMVATPFPGLRQMAVFSSAGLIVAWLTVVLVYPTLMKRASIHESVNHWPLPLGDALLGFWQRYLFGQRQWWLMGALLLACSGIFWLHSNDDIRQLQSRPSSLVQSDAEIAHLIGRKGDNRYFLVRGASEEQLLQREEALTTQLSQQVNDGLLQGFQAVTQVLPSQASQIQSQQLITGVYQHNLSTLWDALGLSQPARQEAQQTLLSSESKLLTPEQWQQIPIAKMFDYLWLGQKGDDYFSAVMLNGVRKGWNSDTMAELPGVSFEDKTTATSELFGRYRGLMSDLLMVAYGVIFLLLAWRYGWAGGFRVVLPPLAAAGLTLSLLAVVGQPINLFNILALLMVLGIGIDYTLFFRELSHSDETANRESYRFTLMAITLSALTTLLSFGLLALSETAAISSFGITVLVGISFCYLLSPFSIKEGEDACD